MEHFSLTALRTHRQSYLEFLRTTDLSAGIYRLAAGSADPQSPHSEDEIYFVTRGRARFSSGSRDVVVSPGDILFVPAHEVHLFHDITEDLELLVFFAPAEGTRESTG